MSTWYECKFDSGITSSIITESGNFAYITTYPNFINLTAINGYYAKDIFYDPTALVDSYYTYVGYPDFTFCTNYCYSKLSFILSEPQDLTLIEAYDSNQNDKLIFTISKAGEMRVSTNGSTYGFTTKFEFSSKLSEIIIRRTPISDSLTDYSDIKLYVKEGSFFTEYPLWVREETKSTISTNELLLFKNCRVIAKSFKMWNEVS